MVIAKRELREVAMEIKDDVAVDVDEEVALTLLGVNEAVDLKIGIKVVGLAFFECLLVLGPRESGLDLGLLVLVWVLEAQELG